VKAEKVQGRWKVTQGNMWVLDFGSSQANAKRAVAVIKHYRLNAQCFVGRPAAPGKTVMQYFLSQGRPPQGAFAGETATRFTLPTLTVLRLGGNWQLMDMDPATPVTSLLNFGANKSDAWKAFETIARYRFGYRCRVGTLNQMMYFRR